MKKRAATHIHFRKPGEPMFDNQRVDASQLEDRRGQKMTPKPFDLTNMNTPTGGHAGRAMGWPQAPKGDAKFKPSKRKKSKNKRVPD